MVPKKTSNVVLRFASSRKIPHCVTPRSFPNSTKNSNYKLARIVLI